MCLPVAGTHLPTSIFRHLGYHPHTKATYFSTGRLGLTHSAGKLSQCEIDTRDSFQFSWARGSVFIGTKRCKFVDDSAVKKNYFFFEDFFFWKKRIFQGEGDSGDMLNMYGWTVGKNRQLSLRLDALKWPILTHCDLKKMMKPNRLIHDKIWVPTEFGRGTLN
jgi:hypothetical protein